MSRRETIIAGNADFEIETCQGGIRIDINNIGVGDEGGSERLHWMFVNREQAVAIARAMLKAAETLE